MFSATISHSVSIFILNASQMTGLVNFVFHNENIVVVFYNKLAFKKVVLFLTLSVYLKNQRTNGPVNAHRILWPSKAQNIQNLENIW